MAVTSLVLTIHQELPEHRIATDFMISPMPTLVELGGGNDADLDQFVAAVIGYDVHQDSLLVAIPSDVLGTDEPKILEFYADGDDYVCEYAPGSSGGEGGTVTRFDVSTNLITQGSEE